MKYSSWPGIPVRAITCAGNNERTVGRRTQHHVITRNDVLTGCIGATLSIAKLLATPLTSCRRARASSLRITRLAGGGRWRFIVRTRLCRRFWPLLHPRQGHVNSSNRPTAGPTITPGDRGWANRRCPPPLMQGPGLWQTKPQRARVSNLSSLGYDLSVGSHAMIRV
jgi:hypothetical protein